MVQADLYKYKHKCGTSTAPWTPSVATSGSPVIVDCTVPVGWFCIARSSTGGLDPANKDVSVKFHS